MEKPTFKKICKMYIQQLTNFPYIEKDFDALTDYQLLCKIVDYLNKVIENQNTQNETITQLYNAFVTLKDYVDNYFDNLDVQEEINNKLEEMAESGQLTDIIAQYLGLAGMITFDTVTDMKLAENLVNGSKCRTLGYHSVNDGGGSYYKVRTVTNEDVENDMDIIALSNESLVAEFVYDNMLCPLQFGAKGDGTTDDSDIISFSITKASSKQIPIILNKKYYINKQILINTGTSLVIYGSKSQIGSLIAGNTSQFANITFGNNGYFEINGITNITFDNVGFNGTNKAIVIKSFRNRIINCGFNGFDTAIETATGSLNWVGENVIDKCVFNSVGTCIKLSHGSDGDITGNLADSTCEYFINSTSDAGYKIENNHDYTNKGSIITGYNVTFTGNYIDGFNKLTITGNSACTITGNTFIGASPVEGKNYCIKYTSSTIGSGCVTGNNVATSLNVEANQYLYFIKLEGVSNFARVTISGNCLRVCKALLDYNQGTDFSLLNIEQNTPFNYYVVSSKVISVDEFQSSINGGIVQCHTKVTLAGSQTTTDVFRLENICSKWLHIVKMNNDNTIYTFFGGRSITLQGNFTPATGFEAWSFGIRDDAGLPPLIEKSN